MTARGLVVVLVLVLVLEPAHAQDAAELAEKAFAAITDLCDLEPRDLDGDRARLEQAIAGGLESREVEAGLAAARALDAERRRDAAGASAAARRCEEAASLAERPTLTLERLVGLASLAAARTERRPQERARAFEAAAKAFAAASDREAPDRWIDLYRRGVVAAELGRLAEAGAAFEAAARALDAGPAPQPPERARAAYRAIGRALADQGLIRDGAEWLGRGDAVDERGEVLLRLEPTSTGGAPADVPASVTAAAVAAFLEPRRPSRHDAYAAALEAAGDASRAAEARQRADAVRAALKAAAADGREMALATVVRQAESLLADGRPADALARLPNAAAIHPEDGQAIRLRLRALLAVQAAHPGQRTEDARPLAEALLARGPEVAEFHALAAEAAERRGEMDAARAGAARALALDPTEARAQAIRDRLGAPPATARPTAPHGVTATAAPPPGPPLPWQAIGAIGVGGAALLVFLLTRRRPAPAPAGEKESSGSGYLLALDASKPWKAKGAGAAGAVGAAGAGAGVADEAGTESQKARSLAARKAAAAAAEEAEAAGPPVPVAKLALLLAIVAGGVGYLLVATRTPLVEVAVKTRASGPPIAIYAGRHPDDDVIGLVQPGTVVHLRLDTSPAAGGHVQVHTGPRIPVRIVRENGRVSFGCIDAANLDARDFAAAKAHEAAK